MSKVTQDDFMDDFLQDAHKALKDIRACLSYQGSNKEYRQNAKLAATVLASYTRHYASLTNREAHAFNVRRWVESQKALPGADTTKALPSGE